MAYIVLPYLSAGLLRRTTCLTKAESFSNVPNKGIDVASLNGLMTYKPTIPNQVVGWVRNVLREVHVGRESSHQLVADVGIRGTPRDPNAVLYPSKQTTDRVCCIWNHMTLYPHACDHKCLPFVCNIDKPHFVIIIGSIIVYDKHQ